MDGKALVDSVKREVIEPGIRRLMDSQYFTEMRQGKLSIKRLQGWAIQHYLHNKAILKAFALGMVKNAHDQTMFDYFIYQLNEEQSHPDLAKRFGLALGSKKKTSPRRRRFSSVRFIRRARSTTRSRASRRKIARRR